MKDEFQNYERATIFFKENTEVHILTNRKIPNTDKNIFYNGLLLDVKKDYLVIQDQSGQTDIFYFEIVEPVKKRIKKEGFQNE